MAPRSSDSNGATMAENNPTGVSKTASTSASVASMESTDSNTSSNTGDNTDSNTMDMNDDDDDDASYGKRVLDLYHSQVPTNADLNDTRRERVFPLPAWMKPLVVPHLNDPRDYLCVELYVNMLILLIPSVTLFVQYPSHTLGVLFLVARLKLLGQRFMLTLHVTSHRKLCKRTTLVGRALNILPEIVLAPLLGLPPGGYYLHHVLMHHCENNRWWNDLTSTEPHQRDTVRGILTYIATYFVAGAAYLPYYAVQQRRWRLLWTRLLPCCAVYYGGIPYGLWWSWKDSDNDSLMDHYTMRMCIIWLFLVPWVILGGFLMFGNYSQHIFVNPDDPTSNYNLSYVNVNCPSSKMNYNDGYHLLHHINSKLHWSELPTHFLKHLPTYARNDALVMRDLDTKGVLKLVFREDYATLHKHYVHIRPECPRPTVAELEAYLRHRLQPIDVSALAGATRKASSTSSSSQQPQEQRLSRKNKGTKAL